MSASDSAGGPARRSARRDSPANGWAIGGMVAGIAAIALGVLSFWIALALGVIAVALGVVGMFRARALRSGAFAARMAIGLGIAATVLSAALAVTL